MKICVGCDHGAIELKKAVLEVLQEFSHIETEDVGTFSEASVDYPDIAQRVCQRIVSGEADRGIVLCGTGIGISIAANKIKGIRAALCGDTYSARVSRAHNNANVLCLGSRVIGEHLALDIVDVWLKTGFEGGRHKKRVDMIE